MRQQVGHVRGADEYFHELDVELGEKMSRRLDALDRRHHLEASLHIHEPAVLEALTALNYDAATTTLVFIAPLVQVAWASGPPTQAVRRHILSVASHYGVKTGTPVGERLSEWLDRQPANNLFEGTLGIIAKFLSSLPPVEQTAVRDALICSCRETAAVHCRLLSWSSRICAAKRKVIAEIERRLETEPQAPA